MYKPRIFREPNIEGGTGQPTLADLTDPNYTPPEPTSSSDEPPAPIEGLNLDGSIQEGYEKDADGNIVKSVEHPLEGEPDANPEEDEPVENDNPEDDNPEEFWNTVESITGEKYDIDYGDVDPISPEGVALRESHVKQKAALDFESYLKSKYPKGFAYILHLDSGGNDETFFNKEYSPTLPLRSDFESNTDLQMSTVLNDLISKDVDPEIAKITVDKYVKDNVLKEKALKVYEKYEEQQTKQLKELEEFNTRQQKEFQTSVDNLLSTIDKSITESMNIIVPEKKRQEFKSFVQDKIKYSDNKFYITQEIEQGKMGTLLEQLLFQFNGGNLDGLIQRKAKTVATQRLRTSVNKDKQAQNSVGQHPTNERKFIPLGEL